jgi:hypothetical protein
MTLLRIIDIPSYLGLFEQISFTTGSTEEKNYRIFMDSASGMWELNRYDNHKHHLKLPIHSVKSMADYHNHQYVNPNDSDSDAKLYVVWGSGAGYQHLWKVIEKHVDIYGKPLPGIADEEKPYSNGSYYNKSINTLSGYTPKGHKWDNPPNNTGKDFTPGNPLSTKIEKSRTIYFVYTPYAGLTEVTISKEVKGAYADKTKAFGFTVYFTDDTGKPFSAGKTFTYTGDIIPGSGAGKPADDALILLAGGKAEFSLQHGQMIIIKDVPADAMIKIVETADSNYEASITDSVGSSSAIVYSNETGLISVETQRTFAFKNEHSEVTPTGIAGLSRVLEMMLFLAALIISAVLVGTELLRRILWTA